MEIQRIGKGKTFILMWNPEISSVKMDYWNHLQKHYPFSELNWSVWEYEKSTWQDCFYMVKVGNGKTGIVMKGDFRSLPKMGEDWSGKGRPTFYRDLWIRYILNPYEQPILTTDELQKEIPDFDWTGGHSGRALTEEQAEKLDTLWLDYLEKNEAVNEWHEQRCDYYIEPSAVPMIKGIKKLLDALDWYENEEDKLKDGAFHDTVNLGFTENYEKGTFTLRYMLQDGDSVATIECSELAKLKIDLEKDGNMDWFRISEVNDHYLHLEANGVEVWCKNIEIKSIDPFMGKSYPVGI